jgi:replicative DNA helicase
MPSGPQSTKECAERWILGTLLLHPEKWHDVQQHLHADEFTDGEHRKLAEIYWTQQRDEGEPTLAEFVSLLDDDLKQLAILLVDEVEALSDVEQTLSEAMKHLNEERHRRESAKLIAELRRTTEQKGVDKGSEESQAIDEIDLLKKLQEQARRPDLRRVGS